MIHISVKCDFCGEHYKDDLNETFDIACYPQDILYSLKRIRERATYRYWIYSSSNKRWYCPKCAKERKAYEGKLAYLNNPEPMRSLDKEEQKNYTKAINKVYKPTGVKLFDKENE